jgi:hypothetical protein
MRRHILHWLPFAMRSNIRTCCLVLPSPTDPHAQLRSGSKFEDFQIEALPIVDRVGLQGRFR